MAIDGTKIIDSDSGYDVYNSVVERYKNGENIELILSEILAEADSYSFNELYAEIYWTALAFSLWKIGHLTDEIKEKALAIIRGGASNLWTEYMDEKAQKSRQKHLEKLAVQIQNENPKPIKPYKPAKSPRKPYFEQGEMLAVTLEQGYGACFVFQVDELPRKIEYHLICTRLLQDEMPTFDQVMSSQIATTKNAVGIKTDCWFTHKDLGEILSAFTKLGKVEFHDKSELWMISPADSLDDIYRQITMDRKTSGLYISDVSKIVKNNSKQ